MTDAVPFWKRHVGEAAVLTDATLGRWFVDIALEGKSSERPDTSLVDLVAQFGLVRPVAKSYTLTADGRVFAERLGIRASVDVSRLITHRRVEKYLTDGELMALWVRYKATPTEADRNRLIEYYLHLVRYQAERIHAKLPNEVELDDLMSTGVFGLIDAVDSFGLDRGVGSFETYCAARIRGQILDELRSMDWVPRLVRSRARTIEYATKELEAQLGRAPTDEELAKSIGVDKGEVARMKHDSSVIGVVSLSRKWFKTDRHEDVREINGLEDTKETDPVRAVQRKELMELMTHGLSRAERLIVIYYYFEEMTLKEIGAVLDLSESRVSQMHSAILKRLRAQLSGRRAEMSEDTSG